MNFAMDDFAHYFGDPIATSYGYKGTWVDTERFDVVPKRSWYEEQLKAVDEELSTLERQQESSLKYYENQRMILQERKEKLKREKENKSG